MDARDYQTAAALFRSARSGYSDPAAVDVELALAEYRAGHVGESEKLLLEAVETGSASQDAYLLLCRILNERGTANRALQIAARGAQAFPDSSEILSIKGSLETKLQSFNEAVATYEKAARLHDSAGSRTALAAAEWRAGMRERSAATFEEAFRRFPREAQTYEVYGTLLLEDAATENKSRAIGLLKKAIYLDATAAEPCYQLGNVELENGRPEQALSYLESAVKLAPQDSRAHYALSRVYRRLGRESDAAGETDAYQKLKAAEQQAARRNSSLGTQP
jgi:tetratricopeptide (TPR) repeat protein